MTNKAQEFLDKVIRWNSSNKSEDVAVRIVCEFSFADDLEAQISSSYWLYESIDSVINEEIDNSVGYTFKKIELIVDDEVRYYADDIKDWEELVKQISKHNISLYLKFIK